MQTQVTFESTLQLSLSSSVALPMVYSIVVLRTYNRVYTNQHPSVHSLVSILCIKQLMFYIYKMTFMIRLSACVYNNNNTTSLLSIIQEQLHTTVYFSWPCYGCAIWWLYFGKWSFPYVLAHSKRPTEWSISTSPVLLSVFSSQSFLSLFWYFIIPMVIVSLQKKRRKVTWDLVSLAFHHCCVQGDEGG